jgi:hypothetical protein
MENKKRKCSEPTATFVHVYDSLFRAPTPAAIAHAARKGKAKKKD